MTTTESSMYFYDVSEDLPYKYIEQDKETGDIYLFGQRVYFRRPVVIMLNPSTSGWTTILDDHSSTFDLIPRRRIRLMEIRLCITERRHDSGESKLVQFKLRLFDNQTNYFSEQVLKRVVLKGNVLANKMSETPVYFTKVIFFGEHTPPIFGYSLICEVLQPTTYCTVGCSIRLWEQYY